MLKSICVKTNKTQDASYILEELEHLELNNLYFSCKKFKNYTNIIIHYKGSTISNFLNSFSKLLTYLVLDLYENSIIRKLILFDYFYFSSSEQDEIFKICISTLNYEDSLIRFETIQKSFYEYLNENKKINLNGFINFRLFDYIKYLDSIIDICVNKFIIDKEYSEFVNLLKEYINSTQSQIEIVHLIYKNKESILLDNFKKIIPINKSVFNTLYLSDISFSSNDYTLNSLLTILPRTLYIHLLDEKDEFINTLELIFDKRVLICNNCDICNMYKKKNIDYLPS